MDVSSPSMKVIGTKPPSTPAENLRKLESLAEECERIRPWKKKKAVLRFKTWDDLYEFCLTRASRCLREQ